MICPRCKAPMAALQQECNDCGWTRPSPHTLALAKKADAERNIKDGALFAAEYERRKFQLTPQAPGETGEQFCKRIDHEKTPAVVRRNMEIGFGLDEWRRQYGLTAIPVSPTLKRLFARWLPREPGEDG